MNVNSFIYNMDDDAANMSSHEVWGARPTKDRAVTATGSQHVDVHVDLVGRHAVVTGGASGIGLATVGVLAASGADVCIADRDESLLEVVVTDLRSRGHLIWGCRTDVTRMDDVAALMDAVAIHTGGHVDIVVANAGVMFTEDLDVVTLEAWDDCLRINLTSVMLTIQAALPLLMKSDHASVVALSSGAGLNARTLAGVAYACAKAGVAQLVRVLGTRLGPAGIRVNAIAPGAADTAMTRDFGAERIAELEHRIPLGRIGTTDEVARTILFLASPLGAYVTGQVLQVSGGL